jgi:16S rRNA (guanine966-N2)-methyltransferase
VRVTGGLHKGRFLSVPPQARPTEGRVREALFSIWREPLEEGARFLDLFAGSGVVGLEAAGRGALRVLCVDWDRRSFPVLQSNRDRLGESLVELRTLELPSGLAQLSTGEGAGEGERFDLVFADPPYRFSGYAALLSAIAPLLADGGEVAVEHSARMAMPAEVEAEPEPLLRTDQRRYGESTLSFYRRFSHGGTP